MLRLAINKVKFTLVTGMVVMAGLVIFGLGLSDVLEAPSKQGYGMLGFGALAASFFCIALLKGWRNPVLFEMDENGFGRVMARQSPILPNLFEAFGRQPFTVELLHFTRQSYNLHFTPPIVTENGRKVASVFVSPKMVLGGADHLQRVVAAINARNSA